jgi:flagellar protein FliL
MSDDAAPAEAPQKKSRKPLILAALLTVVGGGAGFGAGVMGVLPLLGQPDESPEATVPMAVFVALEPVIVALPGVEGFTHLRIAAQIEATPEHAAEVAHLTPRILDVMNSYLRAVDPASLTESGALSRVRGQLLRRIQLIVGSDRVRDLLITEFVLN